MTSLEARLVYVGNQAKFGVPMTLRIEIRLGRHFAPPIPRVKYVGQIARVKENSTSFSCINTVTFQTIFTCMYNFNSHKQRY